MKKDAFTELDEKKDALRKRANAMHIQHITQRNIYYKNSERFMLIMLGIIGGEFFLVALLFDYMVMLNFILTRTIIWLLVALTLGIITRFMHILVFSATHRTYTLRKTESRLRRCVEAIEKYENGVIDNAGIRMLYQDEDVPMPTRVMRMVEITDWLLYSGVMLSCFLFGLVFL